MHRHVQRGTELRVHAYDHPAQSATASAKRDAHRSRDYRVNRVWYNNPTGFAASATDYWVLSVHDGAGNTLASWSTQSTAQGALAADTPVEFVVASGAGVINQLAAGRVLTVTFAKTGTPANLPAGTMMIHGDVL